MVSLKKYSLTCLFLPVLAAIFIIIFSTRANAISCGSGQPCCDGNVLSCCGHAGFDSDGNELEYDLSRCSDNEETEDKEDIDDGGGVDANEDNDSSGNEDLDDGCVGSYKQYRTSGSCGTDERQCCASGRWSGWGKECVDCECKAGETQTATGALYGAPNAKRTCGSDCKWGAYGCDAGHELGYDKVTCYTLCPASCPSGYRRTSYPYVEIQSNCCELDPNAVKPQIKSGTFVANCTMTWGAGVRDPGVNSYSWCKSGATFKPHPNGDKATLSCTQRDSSYCEQPSFNDYMDFTCYGTASVIPPSCATPDYKSICASKGKGYVCTTSAPSSSCRYSTENYCRFLSGKCTKETSSTNNVYTSNTGSFSYMECI